MLNTFPFFSGLVPLCGYSVSAGASALLGYAIFAMPHEFAILANRCQVRFTCRFRKSEMKKTFFAPLLMAVVAFAPVLSHAAAAQAFTDAVTTTTADIATYGAALVGVAAVGIGFVIAIKYLKKIRGAA